LVAARPGLWSELLARQLSSEPDVEVIGRVHDEEQIWLVATTNDPAVIVVDREAFGSGCEGLIVRLRRKVPGARTLVFAARSSDETELALLRAGAAGVLEKERGFPVLLTALRAVAAGELWAHRRVIARALELLQQAELSARQASHLTRREREVVGAVRRGLRNSEVAEALGITERTVKRHLSNIFAKTGASDRSELIKLALEIEGEAGPAA
jgi:DNA-binding NarL/FixJ family response regulator